LASESHHGNDHGRKDLTVDGGLVANATSACDLTERLAALEDEVQRLRSAEAASRKREQQLTTHNLVLVNLSRSSGD
jgi:hypothetical protein